jgi:hypothetical protein
MFFLLSAVKKTFVKIDFLECKLTFMGFEDLMLQHVFIIETGITILVIPNG